ncbi:glycosyltransferase 87 family protein [Streptomyces sp. KR80]|uniref:glycosyltransferase 87 family protein n=1 Tax=Streptomyces sp. KR80 TaxID=3457426 RepID=UPI003FCF83A2
MSAGRTLGAPAAPRAVAHLAQRPVWVVALGAALFAALAALHWSATGFVVMSDFFDLSVYRAGGQALLDGVPLYEGRLGGGAYSFTYPPFAAMLFVPLTLGPVELWQALVFPAGVALLAASVHLALGARNGSRRGRLRAVAALTALLFWLEPVSWTLYLGQINLLLMVLILGDLTGGDGSSRTRARLRGIGVGLAAGIKLTPALFIVHLLLTRQYRAAATATVTAVATVGLSLLIAPDDTVDYWGGTFLHTDRIGEVASQMNQSVNGMLARLTDTAEPPFALWATLAVLTAAAGLGLAAVAHRRGMPLLGVTLCGLTSAAVSPVSWSHHWVWFVPLVVIVLCSAPLSARLLAVLAGFAVVTFAWPLHFFTGHRMDAPPLGVVALPSRHGWEVLYGNAYLFVYAGALAAAAVLSTPIAADHSARGPRAPSAGR